VIHAHEIKDERSLKAVLSLLEKNHLPFKDISLNNGLIISYHNATGELIGSGGIEFYSSCALMRSVAVEQQERGKSYGKEIVQDLLNRARTKSITNVFLLTETAHAYFLKLGFHDIARNNVPQEIKLSSEFASVCPASAVCMTISIGNTEA